MKKLLFYSHDDITICKKEDNGKEEHISSLKMSNRIGSIYKGVVVKSFSKLGYCFVDIGIGAEVFCPEKLSNGYEGLFQITKNQKENKPCEATSKPFLINKFLKFQPGIESRLSHNIKEKEAVNLLKYIPLNGFIIRYSSLKVDPNQLNLQATALTTKWEEIKQKSAKVGKIGAVYIPLDPILAMIARENPDSLETNSLEISKKYPTIQYDPNMKSISFDRVVKLPNGGEIVIDKTEAMWVIDINSSNACKYNNSRNSDETNSLAVKEIAKILRERCITGQVVIDFITSTKKQIPNLISQMKSATSGDSVNQTSIVMLSAFVMYLTRSENNDY